MRDKNDDFQGDPRDYQLDISSLKPQADLPPGDKTHPRAAYETVPPRGDWLAIHFRCCNVYHRIALTADATAYAGHCPKCARGVRVEIDPTSTNTGRFFSAG